MTGRTAFAKGWREPAGGCAPRPAYDDTSILANELDFINEFNAGLRAVAQNRLAIAWPRIPPAHAARICCPNGQRPLNS